MHDDEASVGPWTVDPDALQHLRLETAVRALNADDARAALVEAEELLFSSPNHPEGLGVVARAALLLGDALTAELALEQLRQQGDHSAVTSLLLSQARFGAADLTGSAAAARDATDLRPDMAAAWFQQALAYDRLGCEAEASVAWQRASSLDPDRFQLPSSVADDVWTACLDAAMRALPPEVAPFYKSVPVKWAKYPSLETIRAQSPPLSPLLDAMYAGTPPLEAELRSTQLPEAVWLFRGNLVLPSGNPDDIVRRIHDALVHEASDWLDLPVGPPAAE